MTLVSINHTETVFWSHWQSKGSISPNLSKYRSILAISVPSGSVASAVLTGCSNSARKHSRARWQNSTHAASP